MTEREQAHALVMRHERPDYRARLAARQSRRRVVDRLEQPEAADEAFGGDTLQVEARGFRRDHERQHRRVGCDDDILGEPAFQAEPGDTERAIRS
jgi:hypothetical protein